MNLRLTATAGLVALATSGALVATSAAASAQDRHDPARPAHAVPRPEPGMAQMRQQLASHDPGMARMHQLMTDGPH